MSEESEAANDADVGVPLALRRLVEASAWPDSVAYLILEDPGSQDADTKKTLEGLQARGFVCRSLLVQASAWQFTQAGFANLHAQVRLHNMQPFLQPDPKKAKDACSTYEAILLLEKAGWHHGVRLPGEP
eukprot:7845492-Lingulodinium_polyedra.AAC.1